MLYYKAFSPSNSYIPFYGYFYEDKTFEKLFWITSVYWCVRITKKKNFKDSRAIDVSQK